MRRIGKYFYADKGKKIVMTLKGMDSEEVRQAYLQLDDPALGLGKVPVEWVTKLYVREAARK